MTHQPSAARADRGPVVYLHVGAPKSGTTYVQEVLWRNRRTLARYGVLYPAEATGDHFRAALDLRGVRFRGYDDPAVPGSWQRVVDRARRWRGPTVVISHELLAWASEDQARAAVKSLRPAEVHVVYTARDLVRQLPAMWQEAVKNGNAAGFASYLRGVESAAARGRFGRAFWGSQDAVAVLARWSAAVAADRIHVLTVPQADAPRELLWRRFAELVGFDPTTCDTDVGGSNVSLGRAETELLRRVNRAMDGRLEWPEYEDVVKRWLAQTVLAEQPKAERITLPPRWHTWAAEQSQRLVAGLRDAGYDVVGGLEELLPPPLPEDDRPGRATPPRPGHEATLDVAAETIVRLLLERRPRRRALPHWRAAASRRVRETARRLRARRRTQAPNR